MPPVHVFLVYLSFSVKSVTRRLHLVFEFQNFPGKDAPDPATGASAKPIPQAVLMTLSRMLLTNNLAHP